jgi:DNA modification methylase
VSNAIEHPQTVEMRHPEALHKSSSNARVHSKRQIRQLAKTMAAVGFIGAVIVDENDIILAGEARIEAAKLRKMALVPTIKVGGLTAAKKRVFMLADNKLNEWAGWDRDILVVELGELADLLPTLELDLSITGFEPAELDILLSDRTSQQEPLDTLPEIDPVTVTQPGDLWRLNEHRLLCASALQSASFAKLMEEARARMVFADPPYNVRVSNIQGRGRIKHGEFAFASGEMTAREYIEFLKTTLGNAASVSVDGAVSFVCHDWRHVAEIAEAAGEVYAAALNICIWVKTNAGQGAFYRSAHEFIGVYRAGQGGHQNNVQLGRHGRNRTNVWAYAGINSFGKGRMEALAWHPTVKPVALVADAMRDCTTKGDVVLDPFIGSGTTILAGEKIDRKVFGLEIDPKYVDVAIQRWETYTKREATLEDGRTYADVKAERKKLQPADQQYKRSAS